MKHRMLRLVDTIEMFRCCWCYRRYIRHISTIFFLIVGGITAALLFFSHEAKIFIETPELGALIFAPLLGSVVISLQIVFVAWFIDIRNFKNSLLTLRRLIDWIPSPFLRKRVIKLLADQEEHVVRLKKGRRRWAAKWIVLTTWFLVAWYVLSSPFSAVTHALAGMFKGAPE